MATDAPAKFQKPELIPVPHHHTEHHPETSAAAASAHDGLHFWHFMIGSSIAGMAVHMAIPSNRFKDPFIGRAGRFCVLVEYGDESDKQLQIKQENPGLEVGNTHFICMTARESRYTRVEATPVAYDSPLDIKSKNGSARLSPPKSLCSIFGLKMGRVEQEKNCMGKGFVISREGVFLS
ncbi:Mitochondrial substrate carrier family protein [Striga hermonthica]|uniref:Mitochondrial substrate carrier family protein n=1 Tax=Striga hermonthica TaxID=68872 RepID=A0A9N7MNG3_STRHE|nr:Mitochondrial substrate carrier family protein [Striga hermonthica]